MIAVSALGLSLIGSLSICTPVSAKVAPKTTKAAKFPITFACIHCGQKLTVKSKADLAKKCPVCKCGMVASKCQPPTAK